MQRIISQLNNATQRADAEIHRDQDILIRVFEECVS